MEIPSSEEIEVEILRRKLEGDLLEYLIWYFKYIKREFFIVHWFHRSICNVLIDVYLGIKKDVIITIAPRHGKTEIVVKAFVSWCLAKNSKCKFIHLSYSNDLALDNSSAVKEIVSSDEYQELWPMPLKHDSHAKKKWFNVDGGGVYATSTGGQITGFGAGSVSAEEFSGAIIIDDALKPDDAKSDIIRNRMNERFNGTIKSRRNNTKKTPMILIMQRLHENDMVGFLLNGGSELDFFHLNLPSLNEDGPNKYDPRQKGEALWPDKHSVEDLEKMRIADAMTFAGQYQQRPAPAEGNIFRWFQFYTELPNNIHQRTHSWDFTFKKSDHSDFVVGQNWGATRNGDHYLIDLVRAKMSFSESLLSIKLFCKKHDDYRAVLIEAKANGEAIIDSIKNEVKNVIAINPTESKEARAEAVAPMFQSNRVFLPHPSIAPWINDFVNEMKTFPNAKHDDCHPYSSMIQTPNGKIEIGKIKIGQEVLSWDGEKINVGHVYKSRSTGIKKVVRVTISENTLDMTESHPVLTQRGWVCAGMLKSMDYIVKPTVLNMTTGSGQEKNLDTINQRQLLTGKEIGFIAMFIKNIAMKLLTNYRFTIKTMIKIIMCMRISSSCLRLNILSNMAFLRMESARKVLKNKKKCATLQCLQKKVNTRALSIDGKAEKTLCVMHVKKNLSRIKNQTIRLLIVAKYVETKVIIYIMKHTSAKALSVYGAMESLNIKKIFIENFAHQIAAININMQTEKTPKNAAFASNNSGHITGTDMIFAKNAISTKGNVLNVNLYSRQKEVEGKCIAILLAIKDSIGEKINKTPISNKLNANFEKITSVEFLREEECFAIDVDFYHNYLIDGYVVHNCVDAATQYLNYVRQNKIGSFGGMSKNNASSSFKNTEKRLDFRN